MRVNTLGPGAATRMTNTVPGRSEDLGEPDPLRHPKLVSPAVLFMCSEDAPNGVVIHASSGSFSMSQIVVNEPIELGPEAVYEDLEPLRDRLMDMTGAKPRERRRPQRRG